MRRLVGFEKRFVMGWLASLAETVYTGFEIMRAKESIG
jgi:hypothetical protein